MAKVKNHSEEVKVGDRFMFGANWQSFLDTLNEFRIIEAERSLKDMLVVDSLEGKRFIDIGCGSGIFSLAAKRLGAEVYSFDYDPLSVACTKELKKRFFPADSSWSISEGSVLDVQFLEGIHKFDVVYSWGVLHHTGNMSLAISNTMRLVKLGGLCFIAIYNDQGEVSKIWTAIKKIYCSSFIGRLLIKTILFPCFFMRSVLCSLVKHKNPVDYFSAYKAKRGMSITHDWNDWLGGYPFEVAKPEKIIEKFKTAYFTLEKMVSTNRLGCNQFVFRKTRE